MVPMQNKSAYSNSCGLFSIALATALAFECDLSKLEFVESDMRNHLKTCFEEGTIRMYPVK